MRDFLNGWVSEYSESVGYVSDSELVLYEGKLPMSRTPPIAYVLLIVKSGISLVAPWPDPLFQYSCYCHGRPAGCIIFSTGLWL
jgi:hypothetical protein